MTRVVFRNDRAARTTVGHFVCGSVIVAGVAALYLQRDPTLTPAQVLPAILEDASHGLRFKGPLSPNRIVSTVGLLKARARNYRTHTTV